MSQRYQDFQRRLNEALAARDRANRCALCRLNLAESPQIVEDFLILDKRFCSSECLKQFKTERGKVHA